MNRIRSRWVALAVAPLSVALTSCSAIPGEEFAVAPAMKAGARTGGTLTVGITRPGGIDPVNAYEPVGKLISSTMCDTFVTLDPETGQLREGLARSLVFSPDGTTLTFKMRRPLSFNDGTNLDPLDSDFSFRLLAAASTASYVRGLVEPISTGISAAVGGTAEEDRILAEDVVSDKVAKPIAIALNDADFQLFMSKGNGGAIRALAEPALAPISHAAYRRDPVAFARNPVCVGPYKLAEPYNPGAATITLVRTPGYHAQNVGYTDGGRGYVDRIEFKIYDTADAAYAAYAEGQVDVVGVPPSRAADAQRHGPALVTASQTAVEFLGVPAGHDPFGNADFRRALSLALDRTALAATLGAGNVPATGFVPSALNIRPGPNGIRTSAVQAKDSPGATFEGCGAATPATANLAEAQRLLAKASAADDLGEQLSAPLTLYVNTDGGYEAMARLAAQQWQSTLGLTVNVVPLGWNDYLQKATQGPGFDGPFRFGWASDAARPVAMFNDAQAFLGPIFTEAGETNWAHWSSPEFDFAFSEDAAKATDVASRGELFRTVESLLCREMPMIPVAFAAPQYLIRVEKLATARASYLAHATGLPLLREIHQR